MDRTLSPAAPATNARRIAAAALLAAAAGALALLAFAPSAVDALGYACPLRAVTGLYCATCGATRATAALLHGHFGEAFGLNPLYVVSLPALAYAAVAGWLRLLPGGPVLPLPRLGGKAVVWTVAVLLAYSALRNLPWPAFAWLAP